MCTVDDLITTLTVVFGLCSFCVAGYIMAVMDFRPKKVSDQKEAEKDLELVEPVVSSQELTLSQLGISQFGDISSLPADQQRRLKMEEHVRNFSQTNPEDVAGIIRSWLSG